MPEYSEMRSTINPNRFLRSVSQAHWGNPQPTRTFRKRIVASIFNSTRRKARKVRPHKFYAPKSDPFWRQS